MLILKSSGVLEEFNEDKIKKIIFWAAKNYDIDTEDFYNRVQRNLKEGMSTKEINQVLTRISAGMISVDNPDFQFVAANIKMFGLRKQVYGDHEPPKFIDHISDLVNKNIYDTEILSKWSAEEIEILESYIDHERDFDFSYAGATQLIEKYLLKSKHTGEIYETPQFAYMLIGMCLHQDEDVEHRIQYVVDFYDAVSKCQISLPTPIMAGVRTPVRQFSSCVVIEAGDSLDSINKASAAIVKYISKRAGIGINGGMIRAEGSKIGNAGVVHTGVRPFWKHFQTAVKSCSQGGVRGGAATLYYPMWHLEYENIIVLKNNKGVDENRIRHLDYGIQVNDLMMERLLSNGYITLLSPNAHPELYDSYFSDSKKFKEIYEELEKNPAIAKKRIKALDAFSSMLIERAGTGRIYPQFVDNVNEYGPFIRELAPIKQSNLCAEIALPTRDINGPDPLINLCTLSAFVLSGFDWQNDTEVLKLARIMVRALDNLLDYQDYPVEEALPSKRMRSLGVGVVNYAGWLADNFLNYDNSNKEAHELFERLQFSLIRASIDLAKEKGAFEDLAISKYGQGLLPIDWYNKTVDDLVEPVYVCDWESLREDLKKYGIRNATLTALMPSESSSVVSNSTNGIEPPRARVSVKQSKDGSFKQLVPNFEENKDLYDYTWDLTRRLGNKPYLTNVAIAQKFVDQSISANTNYIPESYEKGKVPMSVMIDDLMFCWYYSVKNLYYHNTYDGAKDSTDEHEEVADESCASGACKL